MSGCLKSAVFAGAILAISCAAQAQSGPPAAVFDFGAGNFPVNGLLADVHNAVPRQGKNVSFDVATVAGRKIGAAVIEQIAGGNKDGLRFKIPPGDALHGELEALTISLFVKFDPVPRGAILFQRLKQSRSVPGHILFAFQARRGDEESAEVVPQFSIVTEAGGETLSASEARPVARGQWVQFAVVFNAGEARFYYDGEEVGAPVPTFVKKIPDLGAGEITDLATYGFAGAVGEVVIAPQAAFSSEQIRALYKTGISSIPGCHPAKLE